VEAAPILKTKLYAPAVRPGLVERPRLVERLTTGLYRKVTLVSAPAGFGKTTLVAEWLNRAGRPFAWLSLDEGDNDPVRFLTYLVAMVQTIDADVGGAVQTLLGSRQLPPLDTLVTALIDDVAATPDPFVLVLDDYHVIQAEPVHQAVEFLIAHQPPQLHLVLLTRQDPPLPLSRLRVRDEVSEVRADDLRFSVQEVAAFLDRALELTLDQDTISALETRTEGWVAGLQLAALSMRGRSAEQASGFVAAFSGSHRHVIDYLTDEVLARQSDEVRGFLWQTAVLERLSAPLCDAVAGRKDSDSLLRQLEEANLFLIPLDDQRVWYRYHRLFADYLRTELGAESASTLHLRAARWYAAQGLMPEAVRHALASGHVDEAAGMIGLAADDALRSASFRTLLGWLNALPDEQVLASPDLAVYKGFLLFFAGRRDQAVPYAQAAERNLPPEAGPPSRGRLRSLQAHVALSCPDHVGAVRLSREALESLGDGEPFFRSLTLNVLGQGLEMQGDVAAAAEVYRDTYAAERQAGNHLGAVVVFTNLVFALNELGRRRDAEALCRQAIEEGPVPTGRGLPIAEGAYLSWGVLSYEANELDLARWQAQRALDLCQQVNITDGVLWAQYILAQVQLASGEINAMLETCRETRRLVAEPSVYANKMAWFDSLAAQASLLQDDLATAARWAEAKGLGPHDAPHHWDEFAYFVYVRLLLAQNLFEDAGTCLATLEKSAFEGGRKRKLITVYLQQALLEQALGRTKRALARVAKALGLAAPEDYRRVFLDEGSGIIELLDQVRSAAPEFVGQVLRAAGVQAAVSPEGPLAEPLSQRELEILRLIAAGRTNPEIADLLYLSLNTVKWHVKNLYAKLMVGSRVEAAARAQELGLL
jgi:LuxR family maltose regulon positive regulatory protein